MASEFLEVDRARLILIAELHQRLRIALDSGERAATVTKLAAELRLQESAFGLTPLDRRRLEWTIDRGDTAAERTKARRSAKSRRTSRHTILSEPRGSALACPAPKPLGRVKAIVAAFGEPLKQPGASAGRVP